MKIEAEIEFESLEKVRAGSYVEELENGPIF